MSRLVFVFLIALLLAACTIAPREYPELAPPRAAEIKPIRSDRPVVALVLGAGGARGFAHIGVIKVLEAEGIQPEVVVGVSSGSVVAALYAGGFPAATLEEMAFKVEDHELIDFTLFGPGRVEGEALQDYVNKALGNRSIEALERSFAVIATERAVWGMPEVDVGITPGWGGTTRLARLIGRRMAKEINLLGALHPAKRAVALTLWNRVVSDDALESEVERLLTVLRSKNHQGMRQLKYIINRGVECDLYTAQGFEALSAGLTAAASGWWQIEDADQGKGIAAFAEKTEMWNERRRLAKNFWADE